MLQFLHVSEAPWNYFSSLDFCCYCKRRCWNLGQFLLDHQSFVVVHSSIWRDYLRHRPKFRGLWMPLMLKHHLPCLDVLLLGDSWYFLETFVAVPPPNKAHGWQTKAITARSPRMYHNVVTFLSSSFFPSAGRIDIISSHIQ